MSEPYNNDSDAGDGWGTPRWLVEPLSESLGGFDLDPASGAEPVPYARHRYTVEDDGLSLPWRGRVWLNPPYGRSANPKWADKVTEEAARDEVESITALVPASTDRIWFFENYMRADYLTFIKRRIKFIEDGGESEKEATFPSAIVSFGEFPEEYFDAIDRMPRETETVINREVNK